jgi:D-3-phosphoglycerate dehydrogenase
MSFTIFVTAAKLAPAGERLLREAGCRLIYLQGSSDANEVETVLANEPIDAVISRTVDLSARAIERCPRESLKKSSTSVPGQVLYE